MWMRSAGYILIREVALSVLVVAATAFLYAAWKVLQSCWLAPLRIKRAFEAQGVKCLPFLPPRGNLPELSALLRGARASPMPELSHDIAPRVLPHLYHWSKLHGDFFVYWFGSQPRLTLTEPDQAKEILSTKFGYFTKAGRRPDADDLIGGGLVSLEGEQWAQHRRVITPAFFIERLKAMAPIMAACTTAMMDQWEINQVEKRELEIEAFNAFRNLTADIIAHTAFGSSFADGRQVFEMQHEQQVLIDKILRTVYIPGSRYIPTAFNRYRWKLNRNIVSKLRQLVEKRLEASMRTGQDSSAISNDLLGLLIAANGGQLQGSQKSLSIGMDEIIDECKNFFFAGHETTSTLLTWTFLLLASHPEWQERTRKEVRAVCGTELPSAESINQLKVVNMVLNETLRLYPPATIMLRKAPRDLRLGKVVVPAGTVLVVPIIAWHHDKRFWGPDASEFRPERFEGGMGKASSVPHAFLPFSMGPRNCIGQTFAMLEAKVVLSSILQRYRCVRLSPTYRHAPITVLTLQPQHGMPLVFEKLEFPKPHVES